MGVDAAQGVFGHMSPGQAVSPTRHGGSLRSLKSVVPGGEDPFVDRTDDSGRSGADEKKASLLWSPSQARRETVHTETENTFGLWDSNLRQERHGDALPPSGTVERTPDSPPPSPSTPGTSDGEKVTPRENTPPSGPHQHITNLERNTPVLEARRGRAADNGQFPRSVRRHCPAGRDRGTKARWW
ncbi:uncharacterized protein LTR77_004777 [Saxophila tyrrhenica]|uniref:Uncharacterized protein n=1 Tax=Saxophila tyrrhenica TaxID=1690608 RepID=A0AAV9PAY7_9PEZI|nr:hypothetical protein LTR77_004777 [Saxophila tyrrhenica]